MHPPMHTAAHRVPAGFLTAMESTWPERHRQAGLTIVADMINHRGEAGSKFRKKLDDFVKPLVHRIKAGPHGSIVRRDGTTVPLRVVFEHPVQVLRLPPEGHRQGLNLRFNLWVSVLRKPLGLCSTILCSGVPDLLLRTVSWVRASLLIHESFSPGCAQARSPQPFRGNVYTQSTHNCELPGITGQATAPALIPGGLCETPLSLVARPLPEMPQKIATHRIK